MIKKSIAIFIALVLLASLGQYADAQKSEISVGPDIGLPVGDFNNSHSFGIGGSIRYEGGVSKSVAVGLTAGYMSFQGKQVYYGQSQSEGIIPVQLFLKYYTTSMMHGFYIMANAGIVTGKGAKEGNNSIQLGFGPEMGAHFSGVDLGFGYRFFTQSTGSPQYFGFRLGLAFGL